MRVYLIMAISLFATQISAGLQLQKLTELRPPYNQFSPLTPRSISVGPNDRIYLLDSRLSVVVELTSDGGYVRQIGGPGSDIEQFSDPADVCAISGLDVFIADRGNDRVVRLDRELNYLAEFRSLEGTSYDLTFENPRSVLLGPRGDLFIADGSNDRILKIDPTGKPVFSFGEYGQSGGALSGLCRLELDPQGGLWVLDIQGFITRFDEFGSYLTQLRSESTGVPTGLAVSKSAIWVCSDSLLWSFDRKARQKATYSLAELSTNRGATLVDLAFRGDNLWILDSKGAIHRFEIITSK
jgi:hypothetical protein